MDTPLPPVETSKKKPFLVGIIVLFSLGFLYANYMVYTYGKSGKSVPFLTHLTKTIPTPPPLATITPTPFPINRHGRMPFTVMTKTTGPRIIEGWVDPFDVKVGNQQRLALYVVDDNGGIDEITGVWKTDTKEKFVTFARTGGSKSEGWWEGSWTCDDSINYSLKITVTMTNKNGSYTQLVTLR